MSERVLAAMEALRNAKETLEATFGDAAEANSRSSVPSEGSRYITADAQSPSGDLQSTPSEPEMEADPERFRLYRLCACGECGGSGKQVRVVEPTPPRFVRCKTCRGEGRTLDLVATCGTPEAVGVALVTLGREGEWKECPVGVLDTAGAKNEKWVVSPWLPSARNVSDAGRLLRAQR